MLRGKHKSAVNLPGVKTWNQCSDRITLGIIVYLRHYGLGGNDTTLWSQWQSPRWSAVTAGRL